MRLFRDQKAARKAGFIIGYCGGVYQPHADGGELAGEVLTDRERALLEALERIRAGAAPIVPGVNCITSEPLEAAEALINSMNVEG